MQRLTYIANIRLPTEKAHGLQVVRMCEAFTRLGVATTLLHPARHQPGALTGVDPLTYYGVQIPFAIRTLANADVVRSERWLPGQVFTAAFFLHSVLWARYAVRCATRRAPAHLYMTRDIAVAAALVRKGLPVILEIHKAPERSSLRLLRRVVAHTSLRLLVVMTDALRATLAGRGAVAPNTTVEHDGVDIARYACPPNAAWRAAGPVVLYTGQLFREKGIETLVKAARLLDGYAEIKIVGGMPQHVAEWRARIADPRWQNVTFLGHFPPERLPAIQKAADLLVLPNSGRHAHSACYTSPMKLFEYMAAGRAIVASDVPAIREVLQHDVNAWLVPPDDPAALAAAVRRLLDDACTRHRLARRAEEDAQRHSWIGRASRIAQAAGFHVPAFAPPRASVSP